MVDTDFRNWNVSAPGVEDSVLRIFWREIMKEGELRDWFGRGLRMASSKKLVGIFGGLIRQRRTCGVEVYGEMGFSKLNWLPRYVCIYTLDVSRP